MKIKISHIRRFPVVLPSFFAALFLISISADAVESWQVPPGASSTPSAAQPGRHLTFIATFDEPGALDASFSLRDTRAGQFEAAYEPRGHRGGGVRVVGPSTCLHYNSLQVLNPLRGTITLWVKADGEGGFLDGRDHWLASFRSGWDHHLLGLMVRGADGRLVFGYGNRALEEKTSLTMPVPAEKGGGWHQVICSWDLERNRLWLAMDGHGVAGTVVGIPPGLLWILFVGSCCSDSGSDYPINGVVDDLVVYDLPADRCWAGPPDEPMVDMALLNQAEAGVRRFLNFWERHQKSGGWGIMYAWPTMIPTEAQTREWMHPIGYISNDKSWSTASTAIQFLYAYQVLGDRPYLDVARTTGEMYLGAIKEHGGWYPGYITGPHGIEPLYGPKIKLQDSDQSHPIYLFAALYNELKDERFLQAAMAGGEFYLKAQNPNGSWSHSYDLEKGIGLTAIGKPEGGEINDRATSDGMDVMLMMFHLTEDKKYLDALLRAGDWLIEAQSDGPTYAWAEQYDRDNNPIWARNFEPPCDCVGRSQLAIRALQLMWNLTSDEKYLAPIEKYTDWVEKISTAGACWNYYDPTSGRPVIAVRNQMFYTDDPSRIEAYLKLVHLDTPRPQATVRIDTDNIGAWLSDAARGVAPPSRLPPAPAECREYLSSTQGAVAELIGSQDRSGVWVRPRQASYAATWGSLAYPYDQNALDVLKFIERGRMLLGELEFVRRGDGRQLDSAFPGAGWYDTSLRPAR